VVVHDGDDGWAPSSQLSVFLFSLIPPDLLSNQPQQTQEDSCFDNPDEINLDVDVDDDFDATPSTLVPAPTSVAPPAATTMVNANPDVIILDDDVELMADVAPIPILIPALPPHPSADNGAPARRNGESH
jgi:hypothetical protein